MPDDPMDPAALAERLARGETVVLHGAPPPPLHAGRPAPAAPAAATATSPHRLSARGRYQPIYPESPYPGDCSVVAATWDASVAGYYDWVGVYDGEPSGWRGYQDWSWTYDVSSGTWQSPWAVIDPARPTRWWVAYVVWNGSDYEIVAKQQMNLAPDWMAGLPALAGRRLREVVLPGSHDSGTSSITGSSPASPDYPSKWLPAGVAAMWSKTQQLAVPDQLASGIRYLDLRVWLDPSGAFYTCHALRGDPLDPILTAVRDFLTAHPREIVILDFHLFYGMGPADHARVIARVREVLGDLLVPTAMGIDLTVGDLWASGHRVLVIYEDDSAKDAPDLWPGTSITMGYDNSTGGKQTEADLKAWLDGVVATPHAGFWTIQGMLTPTSTVGIGSTLLGLGLISWASDINGPVIDWVRGWGATRPLNIVLVDFSDLSELVATAIALNA